MAIHFQHVSYQYPSGSYQFYQAINDISLSIPSQGEMIAIVGQTGSGKSTLAQHMNALLFPSSGSVDIFGSTIRQKRDKKISYNHLRKHVGLVFQFPEYQLFEETVQKDIMFGPMNFKISAPEAEERARKAIVQVGLDETYLKRNPFNLSGGEKKRVSIAGILALEPDILVLDEPTSGLDPRGKIQMMELFMAIQKQTDKTIIIITHDMDLVYRYMDRVIVMHEGRLIRDESPDQLFRRKNLAELHLDYPETISVLSAIKSHFSLDIDIYQKDMDEALAELRRAVGR